MIRDSDAAHAFPLLLGHVKRTSTGFLSQVTIFLCAGTEIAYCILSLTAKLYLGLFLLINVIYVDGSADETLRAGNEVR